MHHPIYNDRFSGTVAWDLRDGILYGIDKHRELCEEWIAGHVVIDSASGFPECGFRTRLGAETWHRSLGLTADYCYVTAYSSWFVSGPFDPSSPVFRSWGQAEQWLACQPSALVAFSQIEPYG